MPTYIVSSFNGYLCKAWKSDNTLREQVIISMSATLYNIFNGTVINMWQKITKKDIFSF